MSCYLELRGSWLNDSRPPVGDLVSIVIVVTGEYHVNLHDHIQGTILDIEVHSARCSKKINIDPNSTSETSVEVSNADTEDSHADTEAFLIRIDGKVDLVEMLEQNKLPRESLTVQGPKLIWSRRLLPLPDGTSAKGDCSFDCFTV